MFLSRLVLNPRNPAVRRDLGSPGELHRTVLRAFGQVDGPARKEHGVLFRVDELQDGAVLYAYVQSRQEPDWTFLPQGYLAPAPWGEDNPGVKALEPRWQALETGQRLRFRLLANATRRISREGGGSTRVPLRRPEALSAWIARKAEQGGFVIAEQELAVDPRPAHKGRHSSGGSVTIEPTLFEGLLQVTDGEQFRHTLQVGIGPAKAYGCGLLSIART